MRPKLHIWRTNLYLQINHNYKNGQLATRGRQVRHLHDVSRGVLLRLPPGRNYGTNTGPTWERTAVFSWWLRISVLSDPSGILLCVKVAIYIMFPLVYFCATPPSMFFGIEKRSKMREERGIPLITGHHCTVTATSDLEYY